jgi:hypothetical protein
MSKPLSTDLETPSSLPYFLWDDPLTVAELKRRLSDGAAEERWRLLGKVLREARDTDVWKFTTPTFVWHNLSRLDKYLGRRRDFWKFLLGRWNDEGLIHD